MSCKSPALVNVWVARSTASRLVCFPGDEMEANRDGLWAGYSDFANAYGPSGHRSPVTSQYLCVQRAVGEERLGRFQQRDRRRSPERCEGWRNHRSTAKTSSPRTCFSPYARHSRHCTCSCPPIERIPVSYPKVEAAGQVWQETSALLAWRSSRTTALTPRMLKKA